MAGGSQFDRRVAAIRGKGRHCVRGPPPPVGGYNPLIDIERDNEIIELGARKERAARVSWSVLVH
jgi:hypothetical protein